MPPCKRERPGSGAGMCWPIRESPSAIQRPRSLRPRRPRPSRSSGHLRKGHHSRHRSEVPLDNEGVRAGLSVPARRRADRRTTSGPHLLPRAGAGMRGLLVALRNCHLSHVTVVNLSHPPIYSREFHFIHIYSEVNPTIRVWNRFSAAPQKTDTAPVTLVTGDSSVVCWGGAR